MRVVYLVFLLVVLMILMIVDKAHIPSNSFIGNKWTLNEGDDEVYVCDLKMVSPSLGLTLT